MSFFKSRDKKHLHIFTPQIAEWQFPGPNISTSQRGCSRNRTLVCTWLWVSQSKRSGEEITPHPHLVPSLLQQAVNSAVEYSASLQAFRSQSSVNDSVTELFPFFMSLPCRDFQIISLKCFSPHLAACLVPRRHNFQ